MTEVSVRELRNNLAKYLRRAGGGEEIVVTSRGKPVAALSRPPAREKTLDEKLDDLERRGFLRRGRGKYVPPAKMIKLRGEGPSVSEMILEDRGPRVG